jgi:hypothetical protein
MPRHLEANIEDDRNSDISVVKPIAEFAFPLHPLEMTTSQAMSSFYFQQIKPYMPFYDCMLSSIHINGTHRNGCWNLMAVPMLNLTTLYFVHKEIDRSPIRSFPL